MRYEEKPRARDERMKAILPELARKAPWSGYRPMWRQVRETVEAIGENAFRRLWKLLDLRARKPLKPRKRTPRLQVLPGLRSGGLNQGWCMDFMKDKTRDGRALRILSIVDEYTRECIALLVARSFKAVDVIVALEALVSRRGRPAYLRSDNGPEFVAKEVKRWADGKGVRLVRSEPGSPWQNPFSETFHSRARWEFLEREEFGSLVEAQVLCESYRLWYNEQRPHSALGYLPPARYAEMVRWTAPAQPVPPVGLQPA